MDWSHLADEYIQILSTAAYYVILWIWVAIPFAGIAFLIYAAFKWGQSMTPNARSERKLDKELKQLLKEASHGR